MGFIDANNNDDASLKSNDTTEIVNEDSDDPFSFDAINKDDAPNNENEKQNPTNKNDD